MYIKKKRFLRSVNYIKLKIIKNKNVILEKGENINVLNVEYISFIVLNSI